MSDGIGKQIFQDTRSASRGASRGTEKLGSVFFRSMKKSLSPQELEISDKSIASASSRDESFDFVLRRGGTDPDLSIFSDGHLLRESKMNSLQQAEITSGIIFQQIYGEKKRVRLNKKGILLEAKKGRLNREEYDEEFLVSRVKNMDRECRLADVIISVPGESKLQLQKDLKKWEQRFSGEGSVDSKRAASERKLKLFSRRVLSEEDVSSNGSYSELQEKFSRSHDFVNELKPIEVELFLKADKEYENHMAHLARVRGKFASQGTYPASTNLSEKERDRSDAIRQAYSGGGPEAESEDVSVLIKEKLRKQVHNIGTENWKYRVM